MSELKEATWKSGKKTRAASEERIRHTRVPSRARAGFLYAGLDPHCARADGGNEICSIFNRDNWLDLAYGSFSLGSVGVVRYVLERRDGRSPLSCCCGVGSSKGTFAADQLRWCRPERGLDARDVSRCRSGSVDAHLGRWLDPGLLSPSLLPSSFYDPFRPRLISPFL